MRAVVEEWLPVLRRCAADVTLCVIDDGSTDATPSVLEQLARSTGVSRWSPRRTPATAGPASTGTGWPSRAAPGGSSRSTPMDSATPRISPSSGDSGRVTRSCSGSVAPPRRLVAGAGVLAAGARGRRGQRHLGARSERPLPSHEQHGSPPGDRRHPRRRRPRERLRGGGARGPRPHPVGRHRVPGAPRREVAPAVAVDDPARARRHGGARPEPRPGTRGWTWDVAASASTDVGARTGWPSTPAPCDWRSAWHRSPTWRCPSACSWPVGCGSLGRSPRRDPPAGHRVLGAPASRYRRRGRGCGAASHRQGAGEHGSPGGGCRRLPRSRGVRGPDLGLGQARGDSQGPGRAALAGRLRDGRGRCGSDVLRRLLPAGRAGRKDRRLDGGQRRPVRVERDRRRAGLLLARGAVRGAGVALPRDIRALLRPRPGGGCDLV